VQIVATPPHSPLTLEAVLRITPALRGVTAYHGVFSMHRASVMGANFHCESIPLGTTLSISLVLRAQTRVLICIATSFFSRTCIPICHRNCSCIHAHVYHFFVWCEARCRFFGRILDLYPYHHYDCVIGNYVAEALTSYCIRSSNQSGQPSSE